MKLFKSKPEDVSIASNEKTDAVERSSAIARLRFDGCTEIEPLLIKLLRHQSFLLRRDAIVTLVGFWKKSEFVDLALQFLHDDEDETVRSGAAYALAEFVTNTGMNKQSVVAGLSTQLKRETQFGAQEECYKGLLRLVAPHKLLPSVSTAFKRERDVDWNLLRSYLP